jgi:hypothetical protein
MRWGDTTPFIFWITSPPKTILEFISPIRNSHPNTIKIVVAFLHASIYIQPNLKSS